MTAAEPAPLRGEPAAKCRAAIDVQAFQEITVEQRDQRALALQRERFDALARGAFDLDGIDETILEIEPDRVLVRDDAL
ncbi:MAG: hypothetical protein WC809_18540 [Sinimarinibacterium sp.]